MRKLSLILATAMIAVPTFAMAAIKLTSNIKAGAKISGDVKFEITAETRELITAMEFYVNGDLRDTDDSTPYEFTLDALKEKEGPIKVKVIAQAASGDQTKLELSLIVDNGVGLGVAHWMAKADDALTSGKWADAALAARIALKADAKHVPAMMALSRANFGRGQMDVAQKYAEDVLAIDKENAQALDLVSAIGLQRAFRASGTNPQETITRIGNALNQAVKSRMTVYEGQLNKLGAVTDANRLEVADVAMRAGRYSLAIDALRPAYERDLNNNPITNRLLYALWRAGRFQEAGRVAINYGTRGKPDGEGFGLLALIYERSGDPTKATEFEKSAVLEDGASLGVRSAQAHLAILRAQPKDFTRITAAMGQEFDSSPEANYYLYLSMYRSGDYEGARARFERSVLADPALYETYLQAAITTMELALQTTLNDKAREFNRTVAKTYFRAALNAKPESFEAFTGLALLAMMEGKLDEALANGRTATKAGPEYASAYYALAIALSEQERQFSVAAEKANAAAQEARRNRLAEEHATQEKRLVEIRRSLDQIRADYQGAVAAYQKLDKAVLGGTTPNDYVRVFNYYSRYGRPPVLILRRASSK